MAVCVWQGSCLLSKGLFATVTMLPRIIHGSLLLECSSCCELMCSVIVVVVMLIVRIFECVQSFLTRPGDVVAVLRYDVIETRRGSCAALLTSCELLCDSFALVSRRVNANRSLHKTESHKSTNTTTIHHDAGFYHCQAVVSRRQPRRSPSLGDSIVYAFGFAFVQGTKISSMNGWLLAVMHTKYYVGYTVCLLSPLAFHMHYRKR
jgi:hypothetical protein